MGWKKGWLEKILRKTADKSKVPVEKVKPKTVGLIKGGAVDTEKLKELLKESIDCAIESISHIPIQPINQKEWEYYCMVWNCSNDYEYAQYMTREVREMLIFYDTNVAYEINMVGRGLLRDIIIEAVSEKKDEIHSYWKDGYIPY